MSKKIYIGNLSYSTTEETLSSVFSSYGEIISAVVIRDRATQQSKGFGFVELTDDTMADKAIVELSGKEIDGRRVRVNIAEDKPRNDRPRSFNRAPRSDRNSGRNREYRDNRY